MNNYLDYEKIIHKVIWKNNVVVNVREDFYQEILIKVWEWIEQDKEQNFLPKQIDYWCKDLMGEKLWRCLPPTLFDKNNVEYEYEDKNLNAKLWDEFMNRSLKIPNHDCRVYQGKVISLITLKVVPENKGRYQYYDDGILRTIRKKDIFSYLSESFSI